jgi:hypothetical protein
MSARPGGGMVDTLALGASAARCEGSSPFPGTKQKRPVYWPFLFGIREEGLETRRRQAGKACLVSEHGKAKFASKGVAKEKMRSWKDFITPNSK